MTGNEQGQSLDIRFGNLLSDSWAAFRDNWLIILTAGFIRELLALLAGGLAFTLFVDLRVWNFVIAFLVRYLVWSALHTGYLTLCLSAANKEPVRLTKIFSKLPLGLQMFYALILFVLAVLLGTILLIFPGLFFAIMFSLFGFALVDSNLNALQAFAESFRMLRMGARARYAVGFVLIAIAFGYFIPFGFEPLLTISLATLYLRIKGENA